MSLIWSDVMTRNPESRPASSSSGRPGKLSFCQYNSELPGFAAGIFLRNIDLLVLILVEIPLDEFLKVSKPHLPRLPLLHLHLVKPAMAQSVPDMLFESVVEEGASTEPAGSYR